MLSALRRDGIDKLAAAVAGHWRCLAEGLAAARQAQARHWLIEGLREAFGREGLRRTGEPALAPGESPFRVMARLGAGLRR